MLAKHNPCVIAIAVLLLATPAAIYAQLKPGQLTLGVHTASNLNETPPDLVRVGVQAAFRLTDVLSAYPSVAWISDHANWQTSLHLRLDPAPSRPGMPIYFGAGASVIRWPEQHTFYDVLLAGFEVNAGPFRPFAEWQLLDLFHRIVDEEPADFALQLYIGVSAVITP